MLIREELSRFHEICTGKLFQHSRSDALLKNHQMVTCCAIPTHIEQSIYSTLGNIEGLGMSQLESTLANLLFHC